MTIYRGRAPFRISFTGGGTDLPEWAKKFGGQVISTTIDKFVYVTLETNESKMITINAYDLGKEVSFPLDQLKNERDFKIICAVLKYFPLKTGITLSIHSDLPPGSGMGTSSSLVVALISVLALFQKKVMNKYDIAKLACKIEREDLQEVGGYQDQYAASFGGFNFITFGKNTLVYRLNLGKDILKELNYRLLLCYTGKTHISSEIQKILVQNFEKIDTHEALLQLKILAEKMRDILVQDDLSQLEIFGNLLHEAWVTKKKTSSMISTQDIEKLYLFARDNGAIGGKILGAGGGGYLLLFIEHSSRMSLINKLNSIGVEIIPFRFEKQGTVSWQIKSKFQN